MFGKHDFHYKWSKIFASKNLAEKKITLDAIEQQELLDDAKRIEDFKPIVPRGEDDYESLIESRKNEA